MKQKPSQWIMCLRWALAAGMWIPAAGCQTAKYAALEKMGVHKREILVDDVKKARDAQQEAKQEFKDALKQFREVVNFNGGELEARYEKMKNILSRSEGKARKVHQRIESVEQVGDALFKEWKAEMRQYTSKELRNSSEAQYEQSLARYKDMLAAMRKAESKIGPVLDPLRDQVLFLKHNLNAKAITSLKSELITIQTNVDGLIKELETAIAEADRFIAGMKTGG